MERRRQGCLSGLMQMAFLNWIYRAAQTKFGAGRGGCAGLSCGAVLLILFIIFSCMIIFGTDWFALRF
jgi:hypothetical protein